MASDRLQDRRGPRGCLRGGGGPVPSQLALYASALEQAFGQRPQASLLFLRGGQLYTPTPLELAAALEETRSRLDAGAMLEVAPSSAEDDHAGYEAEG